MKKHIPNFLTICNLLCGCFAILFSNAPLGLGFIVLAAVFDFLDGFAARLLNAYSPIGKELDSLADMVSFGIAPGFMLWHCFKELFDYQFDGQIYTTYFACIAFAIPVFSAIRLAKFNVDTRQSENFLGLATPANALFWAGFANMDILIMRKDFLRIGFNNVNDDLYLTTNLLYPTIILLVIMCVMCALMLSEIPMFSLKFKNFSFKKNIIRYGFLFGSVVLLIVFRWSALPVIILFYILLSLGHYFIAIYSKKKLEN